MTDDRFDELVGRAFKFSQDWSKVEQAEIFKFILNVMVENEHQQLQTDTNITSPQPPEQEK